MNQNKDTVFASLFTKFKSNREIMEIYEEGGDGE